MRILAFNHFFDQDLAALRAGLTAGESLVSLSYRRVHRRAMRVFPPAAFTGLESAYSPAMADAWRRWEGLVDVLAAWWSAAYRPSVFVTPSDAFFYLRPLIAAFRRLDIPTVVVQKETTISPMVMAEHSLAVGRYVPFMSEAMTVCSERHRQFWIRAGTDPDRVVVTGQPRFDLYAHADALRRESDGPPTLLYLSYDDVAYLPSDTGVAYEGTWRELRRETELALAGAGDRWRIVVKRHPQQPQSEEWLGPRVEQAPRDADTRQLILDADVVVGFQTTALFEAAVARRPVLYAAWGDVYEQSRRLLIPFETFDGMVTHITDGAALRAALQGDPSSLPSPTDPGLAVAVEHVGPVDGRASERALDVVRLHQRQPKVPAAVSTSSKGRAAISGVASLAASIAMRVPAMDRTALANALSRRSEDWRQEWRELRAVTRGTPLED